jgi:hypothetical protein
MLEVRGRYDLLVSGKRSVTAMTEVRGRYASLVCLAEHNRDARGLRLL